MVIYALKILVVFLVAIAAMRLMGKSTIVQLTPYDLVAIFIVGTIITEPLVTTDLGKALLGLAVVVGLYIFFSRLTLVQGINKFFLGEPTILVKHGKIIEKNLKRSHISLMQLLSSLRVSGYPNLADVEYVLLEPIGALSIIPKKEERPLSAKDLGIEVQYEGLPVSLVIDGKIQKKNLQLVHKNEQWLHRELAKKGVKNLNEIIYASLEDGGNFYVDLRAAKEEKAVPENKAIPVIKNGLILSHGLRKANWTKKSLLGNLKKQGVDSLREVQEASINTGGKLEIKNNSTFPKQS